MKNVFVMIFLASFASQQISSGYADSKNSEDLSNRLDGKDMVKRSLNLIKRAEEEGAEADGEGGGKIDEEGGGETGGEVGGETGGEDGRKGNLEGSANGEVTLGGEGEVTIGKGGGLNGSGGGSSGSGDGLSASGVGGSNESESGSSESGSSESGGGGSSESGGSSGSGSGGSSGSGSGGSSGSGSGGSSGSGSGASSGGGSGESNGSGGGSSGSGSGASSGGESGESNGSGGGSSGSGSGASSGGGSGESNGSGGGSSGSDEEGSNESEGGHGGLSGNMGSHMNLCGGVNGSAALARNMAALFESPLQILEGDSVNLLQVEFLNTISGTNLGETIQALIASPFLLSTILSGNAGAIVGGLLGLLGSPLSISGDIWAGGIDGLSESPGEALLTLSAYLNIPLDGLLGAVLSPLTVSNRILNMDLNVLDGLEFGLEGNSSELVLAVLESPELIFKPLIDSLGETIEGIAAPVLSPLQIIIDVFQFGIGSLTRSPLTMAGTLSGSFLSLVNVLLGTVGSPVQLAFDLFNVEEGPLKDSVDIVINALNESPRALNNLLSGSLSVTAAGVLGLLSSPLTLSSDIADLGGSSLTESPHLIGKAWSSNANTILVGILQTLVSPLALCAKLSSGEEIGDFQINLPESLRDGADSSLLSALKIVDVISGNVDQGVDGVAALLSSPLTVSGASVEGGLDSVDGSPNLALSTLSGGLRDTLTGTTHGLFSPLTISNLLIDGTIDIDADGNVVVEGNDDLADFFTAGYDALFQSPLIFDGACGGVGLTLEGILKTASSPLTILRNLTEAHDDQVIGTAFRSPLSIISSLSGNINMSLAGLIDSLTYSVNSFQDSFNNIPDIINHMVTALVESPLTTIKVLTGGSELFIDGILGGFSSPFTIVTDNLRQFGALGLLKSFLDLAYGAIGSLSHATNGVLAIVTSPLLVSAQILSTVSIPNSLAFPEIPHIPEDSALSGYEDNTFIASLSGHIPEPIWTMLNVALQRLRPVAGVDCQCKAYDPDPHFKQDQN